MLTSNGVIRLFAAGDAEVAALARDYVRKRISSTERDRMIVHTQETF